MDDKEHRYEDSFVPLPWWAVLLVALVCWPSASIAQERPNFVFDSEEGRLTLKWEPCSHPWLKDWKVAHWKYKGKDFEACWQIVNDGTRRYVTVLDDSGVVTDFPMGAFKPEETV